MSTHTTSIAVKTASAAYEVHIGSGVLAEIGTRIDALVDGSLRSNKRRAFVVSSPEILALWGEKLLAAFDTPPAILTIPAGESHKRLATIERLAEGLVQAHADRDSILIAFGGGVIGDLTGFLAAIYMRGIPYVQVPTTLLAQVDSSVGGKTGANLAAGKNLIGAFHHPLGVFADTATLSTLPQNELRAGLQEAIKTGIIRDRNLFDLLDHEHEAILAGHLDRLTEVVAASVRVKAEVVSADERESGLRMVLNLGHTLGHAIEAATEYKQLLHGEAIAWGMIAATSLAAHRQCLTQEDAARIARVIRAYGPLKPFTADAAELVALTAKDKKNRSGTRSFVLPTAIGDASIVRDMTEAELLRAASYIVQQAGASA